MCVFCIEITVFSADLTLKFRCVLHNPACNLLVCLVSLPNINSLAQILLRYLIPKVYYDEQKNKQMNGQNNTKTICPSTFSELDA